MMFLWPALSVLTFTYSRFYKFFIFVEVIYRSPKSLRNLKLSMICCPTIDLCLLWSIVRQSCIWPANVPRNFCCWTHRSGGRRFKSGVDPVRATEKSRGWAPPATFASRTQAGACAGEVLMLATWRSRPCSQSGRTRRRSLRCLYGSRSKCCSTSCQSCRNRQGGHISSYQP